MFLPALLCISINSANAGATASKFKKNSQGGGSNRWNAMSAIDNNKDTAWMVPGESENTGEWIQIDAPDGSFSTVNQVGLINGYAKTDETFTDYGRIKKARIEAWEYNDDMVLVNSQRSVDVEFKDSADLQMIKLKTPIQVKSTGGGKYKFVITEIYPGEDYPNIAISEVRIYLDDFKVNPTVEETENGIEGSDEDNLNDKKKNSVWIGGAGAKIGVEAGDASITQVAITPGPAKYARPKTVKVSIRNMSNTYTLKNSSKKQWLWTPSSSGYPGGAYDTVYIEVIDTYKGKSSQDVSIGEIEAKGIGGN